VKVRRWAAAGLGTAILAALACSSPTADVTATELRAVIEAEAIVFENPTVPGPVIGRLAENRVILLGETHHLREHWELVATLMSDLYNDGFRQLLIEAPHMAGWLLDAYVQGSQLVPDWTAPPFYEQRLSMVRDFNLTRAAGDPIHVHGIDANEDWYGGASDFHQLLGWFVETLPTHGPTDPLLDMAYGDAEPDQQRGAVEDLLESLRADQPGLVATWGADRYQQLVDLLTNELVSIDVRAARADDDDKGARMREDLIKSLADDRIAECECGTVINIGGHHAQKAHLMGTDQQWLGDYLTHSSDIAAGSIIVIGFSSAKTELEPGADGTAWDVLDSKSPDNELLRLMAETMPDRTAFLPLDDPIFAERTIAYNSEDVVYISPLKRQFDAIIQYGVAHRMPVN